MNCQQFELMVVDLARAATAGAVAEAALDHARTCRRCADGLSDQGTLSRALRAVSVAVESEEAPPRVEQALLRAFRMQLDISLPATARAGSPRCGRTVRRRAWAVGVAAVLLLALVAAWKFAPPVRRAKQASSPPVNSTTAREVTELGEGEKHPSPSRPIANRAARLSERAPTSNSGGSARRRIRIVEPTAAEATTPFYPLPYGSGLGLDEGWTLVRLEMRRSSLRSLGVPVNGGPADDDMLTVDVVVGQDGLARGIRFVQ